MNMDTEFTTWRRQWQAAADTPAAIDLAANLKTRVTRESRLMTLGLIAPILVTIGIGGGVVLRALESTHPLDIAVMIETWLFILVAWAGSLMIARRTWRPLAETTTAFVDISIRRCRGNIKAATFGAWLYVFQLLFVVLLRRYLEPMELGALLRAWPVIVIGWIGLPLFLAWRFWFVRRQRAALDRLLNLQRELTTDSGD